jgi:hypothetical protein
MTRRPEPGQIDVYRWDEVEGGFLAVSAETGARFAEMFPEPDGWWRVATARGVKGMWVQANVPDPWRVIVHRLLRE